MKRITKTLIIGFGLLLILVLFNGCGGHPRFDQTKSKLINTWDFSGPSTYTVTFNPDETFEYHQTSPKDCIRSGGWKDDEPGLTVGFVNYTYTTDTCEVNVTQGRDLYVISNGNLVLGL